MAMKLNPYLTFNGTAREAMTRYQEVLGGELRITAFSEFGMVDGVDPDGVMHAQLETPAGFVLMASDTGPGFGEVSGDRDSVSISGTADDGETLRGFFRGLADGGRVTMALETQVWGDEFGMVVDRFGIPWMISIASE
jgi:PhnB protein